MSVYVYSFAIICPWTRAIPFCWTNLNPLPSTIHCTNKEIHFTYRHSRYRGGQQSARNQSISPEVRNSAHTTLYEVKCCVRLFLESIFWQWIPRHLIPLLVYPGVWMNPFLLFVWFMRLIVVCYMYISSFVYLMAWGCLLLLGIWSHLSYICGSIFA
jgi:hypothetical protein